MRDIGIGSNGLIYNKALRQTNWNIRSFRSFFQKFYGIQYQFSIKLLFLE